jgi:hypothetical protein
MFEISLKLWGCLGGVQLNPIHSRWWWRVVLRFGFMRVAGVIYVICSWVRMTASVDDLL